MRNPTGDGIRRNGCASRPCGFTKLASKFNMEQLLEQGFETCPTDEDSLCGNLICRHKSTTMTKMTREKRHDDDNDDEAGLFHLQ